MWERVIYIPHLDGGKLYTVYNLHITWGKCVVITGGMCYFRFNNQNLN